MYTLKYSWSIITRNAWRNRQELISAGLTSRRDLMKLGLLTSTGYLLAKHGLSSRVANAKDMISPATRAFVEPLPIMCKSIDIQGNRHEIFDGRIATQAPFNRGIFIFHETAAFDSLYLHAPGI